MCLLIQIYRFLGYLQTPHGRRRRKRVCFWNRSVSFCFASFLPWPPPPPFASFLYVCFSTRQQQSHLRPPRHVDQHWWVRLFRILRKGQTTPRGRAVSKLLSLLGSMAFVETYAVAKLFVAPIFETKDEPIGLPFVLFTRAQSTILSLLCINFSSFHTFLLRTTLEMS